MELQYFKGFPNGDLLYDPGKKSGIRLDPINGPTFLIMELSSEMRLKCRAPGIISVDEDVYKSIVSGASSVPKTAKESEIREELGIPTKEPIWRELP